MSRCPAVMTLLAAVAVGSAAHAQEDASSPYYIGAKLGVTQEDNVFRARSGSADKKDDLVTTYSLLAGLDQPIGRQRLYADAIVSRNQYQDLGSLDNTSYGVSAGVDWSTVERLSGNVNLSANESLARFDPDRIGSTARNIQSTKGVSATARLGVVTRLGLTAGLSYRELEYSLADGPLTGGDAFLTRYFQRQEFDQWSVSGGVDYRFSGLLTAGVGLRHSEATYPRYGFNGTSFQEDKVERNDIDFTALWVPTGASTVRARVSYGISDRADDAALEFDGVSTLVTWNWTPTGKLRFISSLSRDSGRDAAFVDQSFGLQDYDIANSRVSTSVQTRVNYSLTGKIGLNASLRYTDRSLKNTDAGGTASGSDATTAVSIGATWAPLRTVSVGCNASHQRRTTSGADLSSPYSAATYGCFVQVLLQP